MARQTKEVRNQRIFNERMAVAHEIAKVNPSGLFSLIRLIGRGLQAQFIDHVISKPKWTSTNHIEFGSLFFSENYPLTDHGDTFNDLIHQQSGPYYRLRLGRDLILPWPWHKDRIVNSLARIGSSKELGRWTPDMNHAIQLVLPLGVGIVFGGNHSMAAGIANGEGEVINDHTIDISSLYRHVRYDGCGYRRTVDDVIVHADANTEMGAIFEIGRMLIEFGVTFDAQQVSEIAYKRQSNRRR